MRKCTEAGDENVRQHLMQEFGEDGFYVCIDPDCGMMFPWKGVTFRVLEELQYFTDYGGFEEKDASILPVGEYRVVDFDSGARAHDIFLERLSDGKEFYVRIGWAGSKPMIDWRGIQKI